MIHGVETTAPAHEHATNQTPRLSCELAGFPAYVPGRDRLHSVHGTGTQAQRVHLPKVCNTGPTYRGLYDGDWVHSET